MTLSGLRLHNFRCFEALSCPIGEGVTVFMGQNAQGKTSILEAVCVLLRLQSPRCRAAGEMVRFEQDSFGISGEMDEAKLGYAHERGTRRLTVDGEVQKKAGTYLAASGLVVWMGNEDLQLVRGRGEFRRRYLDFLASQVYPEYRGALKAYERALRSRNFLLKQPTPSEAQLSAYTAILIEQGNILTERRTDLVARVQPWAAAAHRHVSGNSSEELTLEYVPGAGADFSASLEESHSTERRRRQTVVGPHRDDVSLAIDRMPAAQYASEGQQRTIALGLKLAQSNVLQDQRQCSPILLLDDIFGELDPARRNALLSYLPTDSQKLITTTHLDWVEDQFAPDFVHRVVKGTIEVSS